MHGFELHSDDNTNEFGTLGLTPLPLPRNYDPPFIRQTLSMDGSPKSSGTF